MQTPDERNIETRVNDTGFVPVDSLERNELDSAAAAPPRYVKEPLFNKKVMAAWALGAIAVWFALSFAVPIALETAKAAIIRAARESGTNTAGKTITIDRDGRVITITRTTETRPPTTQHPPAAAAREAQPARAPQATPPSEKAAPRK